VTHGSLGCHPPLTYADSKRLGRSQNSRAAYDKAIELAGNTARLLPDTPPRPAGIAPANPDRNPCKAVA
jgi:hypothetical protein